MQVKSTCYVFIFSGLLLLLNSQTASAVTYSQSSGVLDKASIVTNCTSLTVVKKPDFVSLSGSGSPYELSASKLVFNYWVTLACDGQQIRFKYTTDYGDNMGTRIARALLKRMDTRQINIFHPIGSPGGVLFRDTGGDAVRVGGICVAIGGKYVFPWTRIDAEKISIMKGIVLDEACVNSIPLDTSPSLD